MPKTAHTSRQKELVRGVGAFSRSAIYKKSGRWAIKNKAAQPKVEKAATTKTKICKSKLEGDDKRVVPVKRTARTYPTEDVKTPLARYAAKPKPSKLRASITPGTVLILLAGRYRGKRVVFLKHLESGLLLVTGPFKINGVPLRRVNQAYVIATSTKVDFNTDLSKVSDDTFAHDEPDVEKEGEGEFFKGDKKEKVLAPERIALQKDVDGPVFEAVSKIPYLQAYLNAHFTLRHHQYPHKMKF